MDATRIEVPTLTKSPTGERAPDMHQTKKGSQWHFGMKAPIGVDACTGLTHTSPTIAVNKHDLKKIDVDWHIAE